MATIVKPAEKLPKDYVALDLETTGFNAQRDRITEIGAVKVREGRIVGDFAQLINPERPIPSRVVQLTGIDADMVADQPVIEDVLGQFIEFLGDDIIVGHNIRFDMGFLSEAEHRTMGFANSFQRRTIDTMTIDKKLFPTERHRLVDLVQRYGIADTEEHRALSDATQTYQCLEWQRRYVSCDSVILPTV
ncbi:MAG: 3'-5' exonuclease [Bifidobacterium sp.]|nr:3'-5' exonuclease [Bifidobacterium sp.]